MESDLQHQHHFLHGHNQHQQTHQKQMNPGLTRYQSAPSSYFSSNLDRDFCEEFLNRPTSPETERVFARFLANSCGNTVSSSSPCEIKQDSPVRESISQINQQPQMVASMNIHSSDTRLHQNQQQQQQQSSYSASQGFYQSRSKPPLPDHNSGSGMNYRSMNSMGLERLPSVKLSSGNNSNLVRHSSSPAGLFSDINIEFENGYAVLRGMGDPGAGKRDPAYSAAGRPPSSSGIMSPIAEMGNKNTGENSPDSGGFGEAPGNDYVSSYPIGPWDDSAMMSIDSKRHVTDDDRILSGLNSSETQNEEAGDRPPMLAHHLSLPKTSAEMATIEKLLQFQDSVPCKIRAKRGCATHPRSIAERVRRTRISERMRKLQDLVPNMDKQTNTSDMLDLAVDYIKDLQRQFKALSENRSRCTCVNKQQP